MVGESRRAAVIVHGALAAVTFIPLLLTAPGRVAADTRAAMYLDTGLFLERAGSLWDASAHLGTVTHQNLGLLFPMGAWFGAADALGLADWVAQRLWLGALLFAAGAGVLHLGRTLCWSLPAATATAALFAGSPYVLQYATRTSVLLLPFAGLPWLVSLAIRATRTGGWRHPALIGLVVFCVGSANATATVLAAVGPALWLVHAVFSGETTARRAAGVAARTTVLAAATSAWWAVALAVQSQHGLPVLTYTETIDDVSLASSAVEVVRGLGYWLFYGREVLDPNVGPAVAYLQNPLLLGLSYLVPLLGLIAAVTLRFRHRSYFVALLGAGTLLAVGAHPVGDTSVLGEAVRDAAGTTAGLALRSSSRAVPLVALALAACIGQGSVVVAARLRRMWGPSLAAAALAGAVLPALFTGGFVDPNFSRPEELPDYWIDATTFLNAAPEAGRVLEVPGTQFAAYRWGTTYEPVSAGLLERPVAAREQLPYGSPASADLLAALDRRIQEGQVEPEALSTVAELLGARWVLVRGDLAFERFLSARPDRLWADLHPLPDGLEEAASFGPASPNVPDPRLPMVDEEALALADDAEVPSPVELLEVPGARPLVRLEPQAGAVVLDGDGEGVLDAAAAGLLPDGVAVLYGSTLLEDPDLLAQVTGRDAVFVITDTNRKRARRWRSVKASTGYTERAEEAPLSADLGEGDLRVFADPLPNSRTTMEQSGAIVEASAYGGPFTVDPEARPAAAVDGRADTAWVVGPFADPIGEHLQLEPDVPRATTSVVVLQRQGAEAGRQITTIEVSVDGGPPVAVQLDDRSLEAPGQLVDLGTTGPVSRLDLRIAAVDGDQSVPYGLAEVALDGLVVEEVVVTPTALLDAVGEQATAAPVTWVLTRLRADALEPVRRDEERLLLRSIDVPGHRTATLSGTARIAAQAGSDTVDALLAGTDPPPGPVVTASSALPGAPERRATAALDGNISTRWEPAFGDLEGAWLAVVAPEPVTVDSLQLALVTDGRHSRPARLRVEIDGSSQVVDVPVLAPSEAPGSVQTVRVPLQPATGREIRVFVEAVDPQSTIDYFTQQPIELPFGIAELGIPGLRVSTGSETFDTGCRDDLLTLDGRPVAVRITGETSDALARRPLEVEGCSELQLAEGPHELRAADGELTGLDLDRLVVATPGDRSGSPPAEAGTVEVLDESATRLRLQVDATEDAWLVLSQSHESGWHARLDGDDLGPPVLLDGHGNGWALPATGGPVEVVLEWVPQRTVRLGFWLTGIGLLACLGLLVAFRPAAGTWRWAPDPPRVSVARIAARRDRVMLAVAAAFVLVGLLAVGPLGGVGLAVLLAAINHPRSANIARLAGPLGFAVAGALVTGTQVLDPRQPELVFWIMGSPHHLALLAVLATVTAVTIDALAGRREGRGAGRERSTRPAEP